MAKSAFDENVPRVRPRLRLGRNADVVTEDVTEPPPLREDGTSETTDSEEPRRRSLVRDLLAVSAEAAEPSESLTLPDEETPPEPEQQPEETSGTEEAPRPAPEKEALVSPEVEEEPQQPSAETLAFEDEESSENSAEENAPTENVVTEPAPRTAPAPATIRASDFPPSDREASTRRSALKRRAAGLSAVPEPVPSAAAFDALDDLESVAELAGELERALAGAAEANEQLRRDLGVSLDDLARATAENKRLAERVERSENDARARSKVVQDLVRELELLEGERDAALTQSADASLEIDALEETLALTERRQHELERALADAHARVRRVEEAAQAQAAQRAALRAELESTRRERDELLLRTAELERERDDLGRSRRALDEVHRALADARARAQRIRPR